MAVSNRTRQSAENVAKEFGINEVYDDWNDLVVSPDLDAIVIGTWPNTHHPITLAALEAGKHVLCEARMAMDSVQAREMLDASNRRPELTAHLVPSPLSFRVDRTVRRLLDEGALGGLFAVDIDFKDGSFPETDAALHWREDRALSGNNIMALGIWYETLMRWVGPAQSVVALGQISQSTRSGPDGPVELAIPDHIDVSAAFPAGFQTHFQISTSAGLAPANQATLFGTEGTLRFEDGSLLMGRRGDSALSPVEIPPSEAGEWTVEEDFIESIRGSEDRATTDFETGVRYMEFTDAVWSSMAERRLIDLPLWSSVDDTREILKKESSF